MLPRLLLAAWLVSACQISFDMPKGSGGAGGPETSGAGATGALGMGPGGGGGTSGGLGGVAGAAALPLGPSALWTFSGSGRPEVVKDRVGHVDLFAYPLDSTNAVVAVEGGALLLSGGNLKSDLEPSTALIQALSTSQEFSLEIWSEMSSDDFAGKRVLFKTTGSDLLNFNQFVTGAAFEVPIPSTTDGGLFVGEHRGQTHHWVGTFSGSARSVGLFVDGDLVSTRALDGPIAFADKPSRVEIGDQLWRGRVFLAALYSRALVASEVRALRIAGWQR